MPKPSAGKEKIRRWVDAWRMAERELDEMKTLELQALTERDSARRFDALRWPRESLWFSPERSGGEGLIEQQRRFRRVGKY